MSRTLPLVFIVLVAAGCAAVPPERQVVDDAAAALGGADRIQSLSTLVVTGSGSAPNAGQNRMPDDELPVWKVTEHARTIDPREHPRAATARSAFQFAGATVQRVNQGLDGDVAYNAAADGTLTRAGEAAARDRRVELLHHPITIVRAALIPPPSSPIHGSKAMNSSSTSRQRRATPRRSHSLRRHVPSRVITMSDNANMGDVAIVTTFSDYEEIDGVKLPRRLTTKMDKYLQFDLQVAKNALAGDVADLAAPASVKSAPAPTPPPIVVTVEPVAKGIWWLAGSATIAASSSSSTTTCCSMKCR